MNDILTVRGSHGEIEVDRKSGLALRADSCDCDHCMVYGDYTTIRIFDLAEWRVRYPGEELPDSLDILDLAYFTHKGIREEADEDWRKDREADMTEPAHEAQHKTTPDAETFECTRCHMTMNDGEHAIAITSGTCEARVAGFMPDDNAYIEILCNECWEKIQKLIYP